MLDSPDLRGTHIFNLELETLDYKVRQSEPIIQRIKALESREKETHIVDGEPTTTKFVLTDRQDSYTWEGPTNIDNGKFAQYDGKDKLKYHVTTLTWKLTFPKMPKAFVPELRRAPRMRGRHVTHTSSMDLPSLYTADISRHWIPYMHGRRGRAYRRMKRVNAQKLPLRFVFGKMRDWALEVLRISQLQDELAEDARRVQLRELRGAVFREQYRERWASEESLLRVTDDLLA